MSVTESFLSRLSQKIKAFYLDQQGVYGVMTALLLLPLIMLVAFTVETTGILLDKTRLSQATDQAALLLTAENNEFRAKKDHSDLMRQNLTAQEKALPADKQFSTRVAKRNQELVQDTVKLYLRSYGEGANAPITITKDFTAFCEPLSKSVKSEGGVICSVQGDVRRKNGFNIINEWVKSPDSRLPVNSGVSYAVKQSSGVPMEVMLVSDFSGSMNQDLNNNNAPLPSGVQSKIQVLREVVDEVTQILLPQGTVDGHNRVGFVTFNTAVRQWNDKKNCALPIFPIAGKDTESIKYNIQLGNGFNETADELTKRVAKKHGKKVDYFSNCQLPGKGSGKPTDKNYTTLECEATDSREEAIKMAIVEEDDITSTKLIKEYMNIKKTVEQIDHFDGSPQKYSITLDVPVGQIDETCPDNHGQPTSQAWFSNGKEQKDLVKTFSSIEPNHQTNASSGMITATNIMSAKDTAYQAKLDKIGKNARRVMVVVSDGIDNFPYWGSFVEFQNNGMCQKIKDKLNSLQNPKYNKEDTRIGFIAISYDPRKGTANSTTNNNMPNYNAWKKCVDDYYYVVKSRQQLLDAFSEILGLQEELGTSSSQKIKRK